MRDRRYRCQIGDLDPRVCIRACPITARLETITLPRANCEVTHSEQPGSGCQTLPCVDRVQLSWMEKQLYIRIDVCIGFLQHSRRPENAKWKGSAGSDAACIALRMPSTTVPAYALLRPDAPTSARPAAPCNDPHVARRPRDSWRKNRYLWFQPQIALDTGRINRVRSTRALDPFPVAAAFIPAAEFFARDRGNQSAGAGLPK